MHPKLGEMKQRKRCSGKRWKMNSKVIKGMAEEVLGKKPKNGKESWWWSPDCNEKIERKKEMKKAYDKELTEERKVMLKEANNEAKRAVAQGGQQCCRVCIRNWKFFFKIVKERNRATKDLTSVRQIKDKNGGVLNDPDKIRMQWR
ncbi:hypothetical protein Pcinc_028962 [Petrolisthes cinctipes]|uniref:Uncharacterized protein n=1 Tax=Petrolisthes cinctipes TaxID=88211 RepID=A0AAE1K6L6_PETCI|nr:hypothetical protein Pcinc_028962 [Petrolisthes cinctipes]